LWVWALVLSFPSGEIREPERTAMLQSVPVRKLVIELRYKPELGFYGKMDGVALGFAEKFPDWERSPLTVEFRNKKKHRRVFLAHRRCFSEADLGAQEPLSEFDFALTTLERVCTGIDVSELKRVGVRQWIAADLGKAFALMVDEIGSRFLSQDSDLASILSDKPTDLAYVVDYATNEGWKYHLRLGPMTKDEWFQRVQYERNVFEGKDEDNSATFEKYRESFPENFLFVDVDCHAEDIAVSQLKQQVTAFRQRSHDVITRLIKHCQG